ncbi:MAG: hypothetical protein WCL27_06980 [Betaproteobacteria bacterium]
MRQIIKVLAYVLLVTSSVFVAGCSSIAPSSMENLDSVQQQLLGDMPLPKGSKIDNNHSLILGSGSNWAGRIVLVAPQGPTNTFSFFRDQFPAAGWTGVSSIKAKTSILVFTKQDRTVTIELTDSGVLSNATEVFLTAAPKGGAQDRMPR